jgi:hypothetical protein
MIHLYEEGKGIHRLELFKILSYIHLLKNNENQSL